MDINNKPLKRLRVITPAFPHTNIFTRAAQRIPSLGPIIVATMANKLPGWVVEVVDENGWRGSRKGDGTVDHKKLQEKDPADVVGFYGGLSSTMPRAWELAEFYKSQGVITIAGSWHVKYLAEESLGKHIDIVVCGDGEKMIQQILLKIEQGKTVKGVFNSPEVNLNNLPMPDFGLVRNMRIKTYPISRIRGCSRNCEFCSINCQPRWATAKCLFDQVRWLVDTRRAKHFMIVDDRIGEDRDGYLEFFRIINKEYGQRLRFTVQSSLEAIEDSEFITAMKQAGVRNVCIGLESPIKDELGDMQKAVKASKMITLVRKWCKHFLIHGMFIFGYPPKQKDPTATSYRERIKAYKIFIRKSRLHSIQILRPVPLIGSKLRERLENEGMLIPLDEAGWQYYDGNFALFKPENMSFEELQRGPSEIMQWFYGPSSWITLPSHTLSMPFYYLVNLLTTWSHSRAWSSWYKGWWVNLVRLGAHRLIKKKQRGEDNKFLSLMKNSDE